MIRHDYPCTQFVSRPVEKTQSCFNQLTDSRVAQMTLALSLIEICFKLQSALPLILNLPKMFPLRTERFRKTISESESYELRQTGFITVWQITAFVPASETLSCSF